MYRVLISTYPFSTGSEIPLKLLQQAKNVEFTLNPLNRKLTEQELADMIEPFDAIIAGTEPISKTVLQRAKNLKHISRVGVGLDSVDLNYADSLGIKISYTAEAPAPAVAELSMGLMLNLLRSITLADQGMKSGKWNRYYGRRIGDIKVGIVGMGRIGSLVLKCLEGFKPAQVLVHDIDTRKLHNLPSFAKACSLEEILHESDIISLHVPLNRQNINLISNVQLSMMKKSSFIINTSRGGIINEKDLFEALENNRIAGAAIDVFEQEPYTGPLCKLSNCLLTSHMGSMSFDCRNRMEIEATEEVLLFLAGSGLKQEVPRYEYP